MRKKFLVIWIVPLFVFMSFNPSSAFNNPVSSGNTLYVGGSGEGNYTSIQDAINDSVDGDTVFVYDDSSPYYENIWINKSIGLIGEDENTTIINFDSDKTAVISLFGEAVLLMNFTIINKRGDGVLIKSNSNSIIGNAFKIWETSIYLWEQSSSNNIISQNSFINNSFGVLVRQGCNNNIISNNIFDENWVGLQVGFQSDEIGTLNNTIEYNILSNSDIDGIHLWHAKETVVSHNIINFTKTGCGLSIEESNYITISDNRIEFNIDAVLIFDSFYITLTRNTIYSNENGSHGLSYGAVNSFNNHNYEIISNNISKNTGYALYLFNGEGVDFKSKNKIFYNNFIDNDKDVYLYNTYFDHWNGNYWNKPRFIPKIMFVEFKIPIGGLKWINFDWHPAQEPYDI